MGLPPFARAGEGAPPTPPRGGPRRPPGFYPPLEPRRTPRLLRHRRTRTRRGLLLHPDVAAPVAAATSAGLQRARAAGRPSPRTLDTTSSLPSILCWVPEHCKPRCSTIAIPRGTVEHDVHIWLTTAPRALERRFLLTPPPSEDLLDRGCFGRRFSARLIRVRTDP